MSSESHCESIFEFLNEISKQISFVVKVPEVLFNGSECQAANWKWTLFFGGVAGGVASLQAVCAQEVTK